MKKRGVLLITIDVTGRAPIYEQICKSICSEISKGMLHENDRLPTARGLAKELGLNPNTVAKAYSLLEREGIIYSVAGKGCYVARHEGKALDKLTEDFAEITKEALETGVSVETLHQIIDEQKKKLEEK